MGLVGWFVVVGVVWCGVVRFDVVWCGLVWLGVVWGDLVVWFGWFCVVWLFCTQYIQ